MFLEDRYLTLAKSATGVYKEKGSRFLSFAAPIDNEEDAKRHIANAKKEYHDAKNICFAWLLGLKQDCFRVYDDHEPKNSAGSPILNQIKAHQISDVIVIVARYYGGTKLGIPGLTHAFATATKEALDIAKTHTKIIKKQYELTFLYNQMNAVMRAIHLTESTIEIQTLTADCQMTIGVPLSKIPVFEKALSADFKIIFRPLS